METKKLRASQHFWNEKAGENPYWYVSSSGPYHGRDLTDFWTSGLRIWNDVKSSVGYSPLRTHVVVEIGCGVGRLTRAISPEVGRVEAFDISEHMLNIAQQSNLPNVGFHLTQGASLTDIAANAADFVLAYCVFQHLPSRQVLQSYLREMLRVAKPGALIAFTMEPRTIKDWLLPVFRVRRRLMELFRSDEATGLYRAEWVGIRLSENTVQRLSPIRLSCTTLHGDKWLFHGQAPA